MTDLTEALARFISEVRTITGEPDGVVEIALHPEAMKRLKYEFGHGMSYAVHGIDSHTIKYMDVPIVEKLPGEARPTRHYSPKLPAE